jgi:hypothetical protein
MRSEDLVRLYGFSKRYWIKAAAAGKIPGARQPSGQNGHWSFDAAEFASVPALTEDSRRAANQS